jgi:CCT motif
VHWLKVYNKNGRIGIYTPCERAAIIARFHKKRANRVWNKRIRYSCRKNLADRRLRVKGRFVKRDLPTVEEDMPDVDDPEAGFCPTEDMPYRRLRRHTIT